jgi:hypothetical protein
VTSEPNGSLSLAPAFIASLSDKSRHGGHSCATL